MREPVVHKRRAGSGALCGAGIGYRTSDLLSDVTCKRCVFHLLVSGEIKIDDPRVTEGMRRKGGFH